EMGAITQNTYQSATRLFPLFGAGSGPKRGRWLQQLPLLEDGFLPTLEGQLVVAGEGQGPRGARLDAQAAHDAAQVVDLIDLRISFPRRDAMLLGVVRTFHVDGVRGTRPRAQLAADALLQPVRVLVQE